MGPDTPIAKLDLPAVMETVVSTLKLATVRDLVALREWQLWDALDQIPKLPEVNKGSAIDTTAFILNEIALPMNKQSRFDSMDELMRWVVPAAAELGIGCQVNLSDPAWPALDITLTNPRGELQLREHNNMVSASPLTYERIVPFREVYNTGFTGRVAQEKSMVIIRQLMRRAHANQAAAART